MRPSIRFIVIHCSNVIPLYFVLAVCGAIYFATDFIIFSFSFIRIYIYMCVYFISKDKRSGTTHHYFPRGKKRRERMRKGARIGVGWKRRVERACTRCSSIIVDFIELFRVFRQTKGLVKFVRANVYGTRFSLSYPAYHRTILRPVFNNDKLYRTDIPMFLQSRQLLNCYT